MKKTLIALAALASTAAFAQSTVTIDGAVDMGVQKYSGASAKLDAANGASQIRFLGTEDLGGGLKAHFTLAQRFSPESGGNDGSTNGRPLFQGESTVGLSGAFGSVKLGRALTAMQGPANNTDPWGTLQVASTALTVAGYTTDPVGSLNGSGAGRTDGIFYSSPKFGGFSFAASLGLKNSNTNPSSATLAQNTKNLTSLFAGYADGPLSVGVGYEQNRREDTVWYVNGTYNFGAFTLGASYGVVDAEFAVAAADGTPAATAISAGDKLKNWNIMATVPMGAITFKAGYGVSKNDTAGVDRSKKLGLGVDYALSKRTKIYTSFGRDSVATSAQGRTAYDIGIRHTF